MIPRNRPCHRSSRGLLLYTLLALGVAVSPERSSAADIGVAITGDTISTAAYALGWYSDPDSVTIVQNVAVPLTTTTQADALDGSASATSTLEFAQTSNALLFYVGYSGTLSDGGLSSVFGDISFTTTEVIGYSLSADLSGFGIENIDILWMSFTLRELDEDGNFVRAVFQELDSALDGPVSIDGMSTIYPVTGTPNGILPPGSYDVVTEFRIDNFLQNPGAAAAAAGSFTLILVPEPRTNTLLTLGLALVGAARRALR